MTLNELLEKDEYYYLKLCDATYDEKTDTTTVVFLYPTQEKPSKELKEKLLKEVCEIIGDMSKIELKFKQSYLDEDIVYGVVCDLIENETPYLRGFASKRDFHVTKQDETFLITVDCSENVKSLLETYKFLELLRKRLEKNLFEEVKIKFCVCKETEKKIDISEKSYASELEEILEKEKIINKMKVDEVLSIIGKLITKNPIFIKDVQTDEEVIIAGKVKNPQMRVFVPLSQKDKENPEQKKKFSFELVDPSGSISVVFFPNEKDIEKLQKITERSEVLIGGKCSEYNGNKNIRAVDISLCNVLTKELKYIWRDPIKEYKVVIPQKMEDMQQMSLFGGLEKVSDYWDNGREVVVFDFETTGLNADTCKIIEIGAVKVRNGTCVETFSTLVNPHEKLEPEIVNLTGINDEMLVFAPDIEEVLPDFHKFCQNSVLSAYNIGFDIRFLLNAGQKYRFLFDNEQIDTLALVRQKVPSLPNYKLSSAVKALNVTLEEAHRALNDAIATAKVFIKLV